jgi:hypothetical protein
MESMDSHPEEPDKLLPETLPDYDKEHWLSGLVRAEVFALAGIIAVAADLVAPFYDLALNVFFMNPEPGDITWLYLPRVITAGVAVVLGLVGLRQAAAQGSASWVRILAGTAVVVGVLLTIGTVVIWLLAPNRADAFPVGIG